LRVISIWTFYLVLYVLLQLIYLLFGLLYKLCIITPSFKSFIFSLSYKVVSPSITIYCATFTYIFFKLLVCCKCRVWLGESVDGWIDDGFSVWMYEKIMGNHSICCVWMYYDVLRFLVQIKIWFFFHDRVFILLKLWLNVVMVYE
jgi:hypothetical protein